MKEAKVDYIKLEDEWKNILRKIYIEEEFNDKLILECKATDKEVAKIEERLEIKIPLIFKKILMEFSKKVSFSWNLSKQMNLPYRFREISHGLIEWDIDKLEYIKNDEYSETLNEILVINDVSNGDIIGIKMDNISESIVYWNHEEDTLNILACNFEEYIINMTKVFGIGNEIWQYESCLDENGINIDLEYTQNWINWFNNFLSFKSDDNFQDLKKLLNFFEYNNYLVPKILINFSKYTKKEILKEILLKLNEVDENQKKIFYQIIAEVLNTFAEEWVESLWNKNEINEEMRSYLTSKCIKENGMEKVIKFIEEKYDFNEIKYQSLIHLKYFGRSEIIDWMIKYTDGIVTKDDWYVLFAISNPTWSQIKEWMGKNKKAKLVAFNAINYMIDYGVNLKIKNAPNKEEVCIYLEEQKKIEILSTKIKLYEKLINNIDKIL
jgi:hypothetical protein